MNIYNTSISAIVFALIVLFTIINSKKNKVSFPLPTINKNIYVGYRSGIVGGISCEINYTTNKVSTLSTGYGITEEVPINNGKTIDSSFECDFKEIVKNKSRQISFSKNGLNFNSTFSRIGSDPVEVSLKPYKIHDIAYVYKTFSSPSTDFPVEFYSNSTANSVYVAYLGISEEDEKNILFIDIDYTNKNIYTISRNNEPVKGTYSGDLNTSFTVIFSDSFLGENKEFEISRLDSDTYNVRLVDSRLFFPMELLSIIDISKLYSLLVFRGSILAEFKRKLLMNRLKKGDIQPIKNVKLKYGFPNVRQRESSKNFLELYKIQKMVQLDFQNTLKNLEYNKRLLTDKLEKKK